ncbi:MAG: endonuclease/exonuclease/phosphatase family protein [Clostridia bacterium]|nr:endonuclease/exonuclease/phosphatase family protein [Clostridia bacterium]
MNTQEILTHAKNILCALLALILPFLGIGLPELGAKGPEDTEIVRIMSFNVRDGEFDREEIVPQVIADYKPDSVGLQECEGTWFLTLKVYLPDYEIIGVGRWTGIQQLGESTAIMYRKDKYKLIDWGTFWLSETPYVPSIGWDANYARTCTWAILENKETGMQYAHFNTHLDNGGWDARLNGLAMILERIKEYDMPVVLTGDFNFTKGTAAYRQLTADMTDVSSVAQTADSGGTAHGYAGGIGTSPIDFICINDKIDTVKTYKIIRDKYNDRYVSDHYPIYSDMVF